MKFTLYELRKLIGTKYLWMTFIILLLLNAVVGSYTAGQKKQNVPVEMIRNIFDIYSEESEEIHARYDEMMAFRNEQRKLGITEIVYENNIYAPEGYNDMQLLQELIYKINYIKGHTRNVNKVISAADMNMEGFAALGITEDSFEYKYQQTAKEVYINTRDNVRIGLEYARGWDQYFSYQAVNIFIFLMLLILGVCIFTQEITSGTMGILYVTKNGRAKTALAKTAAAVIVSVIVVLAFTLETFVIYGIIQGYSSPFNAIQVFNTYQLFPYVISVGGYFLISVLLKLGTCILFTVCIVAVSLFVPNYVPACLIGIGIVGVSFILSAIGGINANHPLKFFNLISLTAVNPLYERYRALNIFGNVVDYTSVFIPGFIVLLLILSAVILIKYLRGIVVSRHKSLKMPEKLVSLKKKLTRSIEKLTSRRRSSGYSMSLYAAEFKKTFGTSKFCIGMIVLLIMKLIMTNELYAPPYSFSDQIYKDYMTKLAGENSEEKEAFIKEEREWMSDVIRRNDEMNEKYLANEISLEEYREYLDDYNYASSRSEHFGRIEQHLRYIKEKAEAGYDAWFVYDTGWTVLMTTSFDWTLYAAVVLLFAGIISGEFDSSSSSGSFAQILRASKHGRRRTFACKLGMACTLTVVIAAVWKVIDYTHITKMYDMPLMNAPVMSMEMFKNTKLEMSIGSYLVMYYILQVVAFVLLAILVSALSGILRKSISIMAGTIMLTLLPAAFGFIGIAVFKYIDYVNFARITPVITLGGSMFIIFLLGLTLITAALLTVSERMWSK